MTDTLRITPRPDCKACHGYGMVYDFVPVPFGSGNCAMPSYCECVEEQIPEAAPDDVDITLVTSDAVRRRDRMDQRAGRVR